MAPTCTNLATAISCPSSNGSYYNNAKIECGINYSSNDVSGSGKSAATLEICIDRCTNTTTCVGGTWTTGTKNCYLKTAIGTKTANTGVNSFFFTPNRVCGAAGSGSSSGSGISSAVSSSQMSISSSKSSVMSSLVMSSSNALVSVSVLRYFNIAD